MAETKIFIGKTQHFTCMEEYQLLLEELVQQLAEGLDISLTPRSLDDVSSSCRYWMTGEKEPYVLDHTLTENTCAYTVMDEQVKVARTSEHGCKSEWIKIYSATFPDGKVQLSIGYHGHRALAKQHQEKLRQMQPEEGAKRLYEALQKELARVTDPEVIKKEKELLGDMPLNECFDVHLENATMEEIKALPNFMKDFYA